MDLLSPLRELEVYSYRSYSTRILALLGSWIGLGHLLTNNLRRTYNVRVWWTGIQFCSINSLRRPPPAAHGGETPGPTARPRLPAMNGPIRTSAGNDVSGVVPQRFLPVQEGLAVDRGPPLAPAFRRLAGAVSGEFSLDVVPVASVARHRRSRSQAAAPRRDNRLSRLLGDSPSVLPRGRRSRRAHRTAG